MKYQYVTVPQFANAVQFIGQEIEGITIRKPKLIFSDCGKMFYVSVCGAQNWLSVETSTDHKHDAYSFNFYSFKAGKQEPAPVDHPLVKLYLEMFYLTYPKVDATIESRNAVVHLNDWVVTTDDGGIFAASPEVFAARYKKVNK